MDVGWASAGYEHRNILRSFECAPTLPPRFQDRTRQHIRDHWAHKLQRRIHKLKPPLAPPEYLKVFVSEDERIDALAWFELKMAPDDPTTVQAQIGALAVRPEVQRSRLGSEGLDLVRETAAKWGRENSATSMRLIGDVHIKNDPCKALISEHGWTLVDEAIIDKHQKWAAAYLIEDD